MSKGHDILNEESSLKKVKNKTTVTMYFIEDGEIRYIELKKNDIHTKFKAYCPFIKLFPFNMKNIFVRDLSCFGKSCQYCINVLIQNK